MGVRPHPSPATVPEVCPGDGAHDQERDHQPCSALGRQRGEMGEGTGHVKQDGQQVKGSYEFVDHHAAHPFSSGKVRVGRYACL